MKALVSGCFGYIGSVLCEHLHNEGFYVVGLDNLFYNQKNSLLNCIKYVDEFHNRDVMDFDYVNRLMKDCDVITPMSALVGAPICDKYPDKAKDVNFKSIENIVKNCSNSQKIIYFNTNSSYGRFDGICTEETPFNPISLYGRVKCDAEKVVMGRENSTTLRLATVFGLSARMRLDLLVNNFCYRAFYNKKIGIFEGGFRRNFVHIKDVCRGVLHCIGNEKTRGNIYNLGLDSANMTKRSLAERVSSYIPCSIVEEEGKDGDQRDYWVSSDKLYKTGFVPKFDLDYGIKELLKFFKSLEGFDDRESMFSWMKNN